MFQQHFLFQIRIVGDIFISGDYIEQDVPDIQHYLDNTCRKWVKSSKVVDKVGFKLYYKR